MKATVLSDNIPFDNLGSEWGLSIYITYKDKKILPDPNIAYFPYGIWVKGKRPLLISCDREGGELYGAIFFL